MPKAIFKSRKILSSSARKPSIQPLLLNFAYRKNGNHYLHTAHPNFPHRSNSNGLKNREIIERISQTLAASLGLSEIYDHLAKAVFELLPVVDMVHLFRPNLRSGSLSCVYGAQQTNLYARVFDPATLEPATGMLQRVACQTREPVRVNDLARFMQTLGKTSNLARRSIPKPGDNSSPVMGSISHLIPRSALDVPMIAGGELIGILEALSSRRNSFSNQDMEMLSLAGNTAAVVIRNNQLSQQAKEFNRDMEASYSATVDSWRRALELRDRATEGHGMRVAEITVQLAVHLGVENTELNHIRFGAQLHDIGKIGVPDKILLKPGPLDDNDFEVMKQHPIYAYEMLYSIPNFSPVLDIPYYHHEKWDGTGYPEGLRGNEIPLPARIFAVVDVWDALRSDRPYRTAWPESRARNYIEEQSGKHFDPRVVDAFLRLMVQTPLVQSIYN